MTIDDKEFEALQQLANKAVDDNKKYEEAFGNLSPLLDKLDKVPELAEILSQKDENFLQGIVNAISEGKLSVNDGKQVAAAAEIVRSEVGDKKFETLDPTRLENLISEKLSAGMKGLEERISKVSEQQAVEAAAAEAMQFIEKTPDFDKYAERIKQLDDEHPEFRSDIRVLYMQAKGEEAIRAGEEGSKAATTDAMKSAVLGVMPNPIAIERGVPIYSDAALADQLVGSSHSSNSYL